MKASNKILFFTGLVILFITIIAIISTGIFLFYDNPDLVKFGKGSDQTMTKEYEVKSFNLVKTSGFWKLKILHSDSCKVIVSSKEYIMEYIKIDVMDRTLILNQTFFTDIPPASPDVFISVPELKGIESNGSVEIYFSNFNLKDLNIKTTGYSKVKGDNSNIKNLQLSSSGIIESDLSLCKVYNAELVLKGSGTIELNMNGGILGGYANGQITIYYSGNTSKQNIYISEPVKLIKRNND